MADMYAVVSRPGPAEASILSELSPTFTVQRRPKGQTTLRCLEGGPTRTAASDDTGNVVCNSSAGTKKSPVVLLHGRGHAATIWAPLLPALAERRRVVAVDLPGFGHSSSIPFSSGSPEQAVRFFVDPVETLLSDRELGLDEAILIGHSLGGLVAMELALRGSIAPRKLVLIGGMGLGPSMTHLSRAFFRAGPERLARLTSPTIFGRISPYPDTPTGRRLAALEYELASIGGGRPEATAAFNALFPAIGPAWNRADRLHEIACPVLLVWGERDEVFPPSVAESAAAAMRDASLHIEPLGHSPHLEAPDRVLPLIEAFLD